MVDPVYRSESHGSDTSISTPSINATLPTGTAQTDGMVIAYDSAFIAGGGAPTHTTPSGWTLVGSGTYNNGILEGRKSYFAKYAGASEGTVTLTSSANAAHIYNRVSYQYGSGIDWSSGITALFGLTASATSHTMPSITTTRRHQLVVYNLSATTTGGITFSDGSSSLTERIDANSSAYFDVIVDAAGAVGTKAINSSIADQMIYGVAVFNGNQVPNAYMARQLRGR